MTYSTEPAEDSRSMPDNEIDIVSYMFPVIGNKHSVVSLYGTIDAYQTFAGLDLYQQNFKKNL